MDWQQAATLAIVAASFLWLLRRTSFSRGKTGACGGCGTCSHAARSASPTILVQLELPRAKETGEDPAKEPPSLGTRSLHPPRQGHCCVGDEHSSRRC